MNEDTPTREPEPTAVGEPVVPQPEDVAPEQAPVVVAPPPEKRRGGLPRWLPLLALAVIPAVVVGLAVFLLSGDSGDKDRSAAVIDGFVHSNGPSDSEVVSFKGQFPPGFPSDFPMYSGAKPVASFMVVSDDGINYFAVLSTTAEATKVYDYYLGVLDKEPWQVQVATSGGEFTGMRFSNPSNPDVEGEVAVYKSDLDNLTNVFISYQDESAEAKRRDAPETKFKLGPSQSLPPGFPSDVPLFSKSGQPVVIETYFERSPGVTEYSLSFLTKGSQGDVIKFYQDEFGKKGWETREPPSGSRDFSLALAFTDKKQLEGTVSVDTFEKDESYQKVEVFVQINRGGAGSGGGSTPRREGN